MPMMARSIVLSDGNLFVAGPEDFVDEKTASRQLGNVETQEKLARQMKAWEGKSGGLLWIVSTRDGQIVSQLKLESPPIFNGMAASKGNLFIVGMDGVVRCLK